MMREWKLLFKPFPYKSFGWCNAHSVQADALWGRSFKFQMKNTPQNQYFPANAERMDVHCLESGCIGKYIPLGPRDFPRASGCISQYIPPLGSVRIQCFIRAECMNRNASYGWVCISFLVFFLKVRSSDSIGSKAQKLLIAKKNVSHILAVWFLSSQDWSDVDEGWLYGQWETGPWWAQHDKVFY